MASMRFSKHVPAVLIREKNSAAALIDHQDLPPFSSACQLWRWLAGHHGSSRMPY
eukprot:CAMPEP_0204597422 /NCGR_PEP_ID=MMETSP0661-20131031/53801_1 /ASSEMBLY_ACC=CAM_ASM_000606 /TAXON_ID=109239 /ORGANISM="Alexandrium margalefi, Strain AMGDE01CS-322" /LENGTH=54 /DNA_ID=CAMNT_0051608119 /DNA_START=13 /DNA_END=174 /DNA_ORIENTATION=+